MQIIIIAGLYSAKCCCCNVCVMAGYDAWPLRAKQLTLCFGIFIVKTKGVVALSLNFVLKMHIPGLLWRLSGEGLACQ